MQEKRRERSRTPGDAFLAAGCSAPPGPPPAPAVLPCGAGARPQPCAPRGSRSLLRVGSVPPSVLPRAPGRPAREGAALGAAPIEPILRERESRRVGEQRPGSHTDSTRSGAAAEPGADPGSLPLPRGPWAGRGRALRQRGAAEREEPPAGGAARSGAGGSAPRRAPRAAPGRMGPS